jgi:hypothetical protein
MPAIDVILNGAFDTRRFFAPDTQPIASIIGTDTAVRVGLQDGLTLAYTGTGLSFTGTVPTAGTITGVQVLRPDGSVLARMDLTLTPWLFAEITGSGPFDSYLANAHRQIYDFAMVQTIAGNTYFQGGNQADVLTTNGMVRPAPQRQYCRIAKAKGEKGCEPNLSLRLLLSASISARRCSTSWP